MATNTALAAQGRAAFASSSSCAGLSRRRHQRERTVLGPSPPSCLSRPWACDFEENLAKYHRCRKAKKPKADAARVSSARALAGENGDRKRKREGGENGDRDRKGGDRAQQQAAGREGGRAGDVEDKRKAGREGGRAGDAAVKRAARVSSGLTRSAAARRLHGHDDDAFSRRPAYRAMHLFVTVSIGRKVWLFAKQSN